MNSYLYIFKASGLQNFIFGTQPLREAIGASQIIIDLTDELLLKTLEQVGPQTDYKIIQRIAGSAIIEFYNQETLAKFYAIWPLIVSEAAPGLELHQWAGPRREKKLFDDLQTGWDALRERRNTDFAPIPELPPLAHRSPDSGEGAISPHPDPKILKHNPQKVVDLASHRKLAASHREGGSAKSVSPGDVKDEWRNLKWETELPKIARNEDSFLAVIHADGNRIGGFLIDLANAVEESDLDDEEIAQIYQRFSEGLNESTRQAVIEALKHLTPPTFFNETLPARPVVIGGDDVSLIVPAKDALPITETFLKYFALNTEGMLQGLQKDFPTLQVFQKPKYKCFTACAGVVFQKHKFPLLLGYDYAESLCSFAKRESTQRDGTTTSSLIFIRHLDSDATDFKARQGQNFVDPHSQIRLSAGPYSLENEQGLIAVDSLRKISASLQKAELPANTARAIIDGLQHSFTAAESTYQRALQFGGGQLKAFEDLLHQAREERLQNQQNFHLLSTLPDAAILEKMEKP